MTKNKISKLLLILLSTIFCIVCRGKEYKVEDIVNPNKVDALEYVADPEHLLDPAVVNIINSRLSTLRHQTTAEVSVVIVPNTGASDIETFASDLFAKWEIGKKDKDNGLLIIVATDQKEARIETGYGMEGLIPDISTIKMINRSLVPKMKEGDINGALLALVDDVSNVLTQPEALEELRSNQKESWEEGFESDISGNDILAFGACIVIGIFLLSIIMYIIDSRRFRRQDRYRQALSWHNQRPSYIILALASLGLGLLPFLLAERKYRRARNKPMQCPACKGKMIKLNEEEDNNLLSPSQDFEEKLNTVDYDVWVCEDCGTVERFPFRIHQQTYEECPSCHTVAMHLIRDHTIVPATTSREGMGEKIYECKYCHNQHHRRYKIPRKEDGTAAALAAGAILGSARNGGGGFGGRTGGGFGGGASGGGGATGRW